MFESIMKFFKKMRKKEENKESSNSKDAAKERLHLVLMQDRANVSADFLELMKQEIIEVIKKYIEVDESAIDVRLTNKENEDGTNGAPALYANIPILNIKNEARKINGKETSESGNTNLKENDDEMSKQNNREVEGEHENIDNQNENKEESKDSQNSEANEDLAEIKENSDGDENKSDENVTSADNQEKINENVNENQNDDKVEQTVKNGNKYQVKADNKKSKNGKK